MKLQRFGTDDVVVPENKVDREVLQLLFVHMKPSYAGYWDVQSNTSDPMGQDDWQGLVWVSWEDKAEKGCLTPSGCVGLKRGVW